MCKHMSQGLKLSTKKNFVMKLFHVACNFVEPESMHVGLKVKMHDSNLIK